VHAFRPKLGFRRVLTPMLENVVPVALEREITGRRGHPIFDFVAPRRLRQMLSAEGRDRGDAYRRWILLALARWLDRHAGLPAPRQS
jgi:hypothetical protein